jgi:DNA-directed RNA polymerase specialized sigma24 family protein
VRVVIETQAHRDEGPPRAGEGRTTQNSWERFELLYRSSRDDIFAYVATLVCDRAAAEDITALAFERAYRRRRTFDRRRGEERAGVLGHVGHSAVDGSQRNRRRDPAVSSHGETEEGLRCEDLTATPWTTRSRAR